VREQLVAAGMNPGQPGDRHAVVHVRDEGSREGVGEMDVALRDQLRDGEGRRKDPLAMTWLRLL
jgi:hypothetical protein